MKKSDVIVVGGGAAGMMAAVFALRSGATVTLFERNRMLGKKLRITGKGRCNVTNDSEPNEIMQNITRNAKFMYSSVFGFSPAKVKEFFEELGVPLKTERGKRVFPVSDKAFDIAFALERSLRELGCEIITDRVCGLICESGRVLGVRASGGDFLSNAVICATGGVSYPNTGSTGDGHKFARDMGIDVTELSPSLVPVVTSKKDKTEELMGLSLKNVVLSVFRGDKKIYSEMGEMLFTHFGVSGPLVLSASAHMQKGSVSGYRMEIDLKPALSYEELDKRILSDFEKYKARDFVNSLGDLLPQRLISSVIRLSGIPERAKVSSITREMREKLLHTLKAYPLSPTAFRPIDEAIITCGGINVKEIDPKTMRAKKYEGLYFAGEILDLDAYTGGYNLQIAWSSGKAAGEAAAEWAINARK